MQTLNFSSKFGDVAIRMREDCSPKTCQYFAELTRAGTFSTASVFRILTSNGIQPSVECPINIVQIGPVRQLEGVRHTTVHEDTRQSGLSHRKWTVSAARFDLGELYGSFFICLEDEPELDFGGNRQPDGQGFAAFGEVVQGFGTLEKIFTMADEKELLSEQIPIENVSVIETSHGGGESEVKT